MVLDCVFQAREAAVVEESGLQCDVAQRRRAELVAVFGVFGDLLQAEVFILPRPVEGHVTDQRCDLGDAYYVLLEIAEHLIYWSGHSVTLHTTGFAKEQQRALFLLGRERILSATRELVDGRVRKYKSEFKLGNGFAKHVEVDWRAALNFRKDLAEEQPISRDHVEPSQYFSANGIVVAGKIKAGDFHSLGRRNERLCNQQVRQVGKVQTFRRRKDKSSSVIKRIVCQRGKARVPHQVRIERRVDHHRRAALIARPGAIWTDDAVVV